MAARKMPKIKKKKIPLPRKVKTGIGAAPTNNFESLCRILSYGFRSKRNILYSKKVFKR